MCKLTLLRDQKLRRIAEGHAHNLDVSQKILGWLEELSPAQPRILELLMALRLAVVATGAC
jgi:hypothetical protein